MNERVKEADVVYTRENVTIHPTHSDRVSDRLKLIKNQPRSLLLLTWIPYKGQNSTDKDKSLYTIRDVSFSDISSIRRHTPTLGWQYVIIVLSSGIAFPPLYFYSGGLKEFLATIKHHVFLARSADDANIFRVNDFQNPLQRTLSSLDMGVSVANVPIPISAGSGTDQERLASDKSSGRQKKKQNDISINVLEKFSLVTRFARETTSQLFRESHVDGFNHNKWKKNDNSVNERRKNDNSVNERRRNDNSIEAQDEITAGSDENQKYSDQVPVAPDPVEFDKLSLVWGKPRQSPLSHKEWATLLDSEGRIKDPKLFRKRIFYGGVEHTLRKEVWTFLLGYHSYESTYAERTKLMSTKKSEYELIKKQWQTISREQARKFTKFRERKGLIDKDVVRTDRSISFYDGDDNPNVHVLRDILLTYSFYNFDLGYCQGMSDLLSPILFVMRDESESFWCFVYLMERLGPNFNRDQSGIHSQLFALSKLVELLDSPLHDYFKKNDCLNYFFCFRWILIQFKRELGYEETMRLWEVLWTHYLSEHLHLYICIAILKRYRSKIMGEEMDFDTLLKFINEPSGKIFLDATLRDAEALCICAGENGEASIPPGTPPSLPLEDSSMYPQLDDDDVL